MRNMIEIKNLSVNFSAGKTRGKKNVLSALSNLSLTVEQGDIFGIVGESGCGKSTLLNSILGFCELSGGTITVLGNEFSSCNQKKILKEARKHMQVVFQNPYTSLNPRLEVHEIVAEPLMLRGEKDKKQLYSKAVEMLEKVGMTEKDAKRNIFEFSGGQRQRVAIARALITNPCIILLDEPVSALDLSVHAQICNLLLDLKEEFNLTYLFVSHNLSLIKHICNKVCVMYLGQVVELGDCTSVFKEPSHPYTKALLSAVLDIRKKTDNVEINGEVSSPINIGRECRFSSRCKHSCEKCKEEMVLKEVEKGHFSACCNIDKWKGETLQQV